MKLIINGKEISLNPQTVSPNLASIVEQLGYNRFLVVVELNERILPQTKWDTQEIKSGDKLEIVTVVGGGSYSD